MSLVQVTDPINEFAVVAYVPAPLGRYLDDIRRRLAPWLPPGRSHVTVLHPRPIRTDPRAVWEDLKCAIAGVQAFPITVDGVQVFEDTRVVYLGLESGQAQLEDLHTAMNRKGALFEEPYPFHPHITLAKGISPQDLESTAAEAERLFRAYRGPRCFQAREFHFVQNTALDLWIDLGSLILPAGKDCTQNLA